MLPASGDVQTCHRTGCGQKFSPNDHQANSCRYHPGEGAQFFTRGFSISIPDYVRCRKSQDCFALVYLLSVIQTAIMKRHGNPLSYCPGHPYFHDGMKEWTCCRKKSHDFGEFMAIPGCTTGRYYAPGLHGGGLHVSLPSAAFASDAFGANSPD